VQIAILEPDGFSGAALEGLRMLGDVRTEGQEHLETFLRGVDVLFVRLARRIDRAFLDMAPDLKIVVSPTTGHTHLDLEALNARGVHLLSLKGETAFLETIRATPEHTVGLLLALLRNYKTAFLSLANPAWDRDANRGEEIAGLKAGIAGYGRVGRKVGEYLSAFGADLRWYDPEIKDTASDARRMDTLPQLIGWSRAVILAASYTPGDKPVIGRAEVDALEGCWLVNTARGELIDETALLDAIAADRLAGVAVDVIRDETGDNDLGRWLEVAEGRNVIVTPHIAGATWTSMRATEEFMVEKLGAARDRGLLKRAGGSVR
jgi:D-3-phosphoglycerate dehydrogenase